MRGFIQLNEPCSFHVSGAAKNNGVTSRGCYVIRDLLSPSHNQ
jgi:hypothetical protein